MNIGKSTKASHRKPGRLRRWLGLTARVLLTVVFALAVAFAAIFARLYWGPISSDTIARSAERVASQALGAGRQAHVGRAALEFNGDDGLSIRLSDIKVGADTDGLVVTVPSAVIRVRAFPLLIGRLEAWSFELNGPTASADLDLLDAGRLASSFGTVTADGNGTPAGDNGGGANAPKPSGDQPAARQDKTGKAPRPEIIGIMGEFGRMMGNAVSHITDEGLASLTARDARIDIALPKKPDGSKRRVAIREIEVAGIFGARDGLDADISISARGSIGRWSTRLRQMSDAATSERRILFEAQDVTLPDLTGLDEPDLKVEMPLYPYLLMEFDAQNRVKVARLSMKLGAGLFRFGKEPEDETLLDEGEMDVAWDSDARRFLINHLSFDFGPTTLAFLGSIAPPSAGESYWQIRLDLEKGLLAPRDVPGKPVSLDGAFIQAGYDQARRVLTIEDAQAHLAGAAFAANGTVDFSVQPSLATMNLVSTPIATEPLKHFWPHWVSAGGRKWFIENVMDGRILASKARLTIPLRVDAPLWPKEAVKLEGAFDGGSARPLGDLPLVVGAEGRFKLENKIFEAVVDKASVATKLGKPPVVQGFRMIVPDALKKIVRGTMDFRFSGEANSVGEIINAPPLSVLDNAKVKVDGATGTVDVRGHIEMTLVPDPEDQNLVYKFEANADKFGSASPIFGRKFSEGQLKFVVDRAGTAITGKAKIDGVQTDVNMYEPADKAVQERRDFSMLLDDAARAKLGLGLDDLISGPMKVDLGQGPAGDASKHMAADLTGARLTLSQFGWSKGQGVPAKAGFDLVPDDKGTRLDNFTVESEGLLLKGQVTLDQQNAFQTADLPKFALRKGDDGKIKIIRGADNVYNVNFEASNFDIRSFVQGMKQASDQRSGTKSKAMDLNVKVRAARLVGFNDVALSDAVIEAEVRSRVVTKLNMTARASGGRSVEISIKPEGNQRTVWIASDDAGSVMAFLDIYDRMIGGNLTLKGTLGKPGAAAGRLQIVGFKLTNKANADQSASLTVNPQGVKELSVRNAEINEDAAFDRFALNFSMANGVINLTDVLAKGPSTGATGSGEINLNNQRLNMAGTLIPLYGLNNTISRVPILGEIFGGGRNEGLIGVTFSVVGKIDDPVLQFNPLSAVAPGPFRKLFEFRPDTRVDPKP